MSLADTERSYYAARGVDPNLSLADMRLEYRLKPAHEYWSTLSGLTPASTYSLQDHRRAAMLSALGLTEDTVKASNTDLAALYFALPV